MEWRRSGSRTRLISSLSVSKRTGHIELEAGGDGLAEWRDVAGEEGDDAGGVVDGVGRGRFDDAVDGDDDGAGDGLGDAARVGRDARSHRF